MKKLTLLKLTSLDKISFVLRSRVITLDGAYNYRCTAMVDTWFDCWSLNLSSLFLNLLIVTELTIESGNSFHALAMRFVKKLFLLLFEQICLVMWWLDLRILAAGPSPREFWPKFLKPWNKRNRNNLFINFNALD